MIAAIILVLALALAPRWGNLAAGSMLLSAVLCPSFADASPVSLLQDIASFAEAILLFLVLGSLMVGFLRSVRGEATPPRQNLRSQPAQRRDIVQKRWAPVKA